MPKSIVATLALVAVLGVTCPIASADLITFDDIPAGNIGTQYLARGVMFFEGNDQQGNSTGILLSSSGQPVTAFVANFGTSVSAPNVMVPAPGSNNDIIVQFFNDMQERTFASLVGLTNDTENVPSVYLEAFDMAGASLGRTSLLGASATGTVSANNIWFAKIYGAPGTGGGLGVDNFQFELSAVPEPSNLISAALGLFALGGYVGVHRARVRRVRSATLPPR